MRNAECGKNAPLVTRSNGILALLSVFRIPRSAFPTPRITERH
jgi:hypothetical protein